MQVLQQWLAPIALDLRGLCDRAILLIEFCGALRRAELTAIKMADTKHPD
jgi:hypothetical protein